MKFGRYVQGERIAHRSEKLGSRMGCKNSVLECVKGTGEEKRKESDVIEQGFLFGNFFYNIMKF